jgi:transposase
VTARWRTREELIHQVVVLTAEGMSMRAVTRALGVSRNTIKKMALREVGWMREPRDVTPTSSESASARSRAA